MTRYELAESICKFSKLGLLDVVKHLIETSTIEEPAYWRNVSLAYAVYAGNLTLVKYLVEGGADIQTSHLWTTTYYGHRHLFHYLVEKKHVKSGAEKEEL